MIVIAAAQGFTVTEIPVPKSASCHPEAVSFVKVTLPSRDPVADQRLPVCVPAFAVLL